MSGAVAERYRSVAGDADAASLDELTGDDFSSVADERPRNMLLSPMVLIAVLAAVGSVVAARSLIGRGSLASPVLLPAARPAECAVAGGAEPDSRCAQPDQPTLAGPDRCRVDGAGRTAGVVQHAAVVWRGPAVDARRLPDHPPGDQRTPAALVGGHDVRAAAGAAGGHQPGAVGAERVGYRTASAGSGGPCAGAPAGRHPRGLARRLGGRGGAGRAGRVRAVVDHPRNPARCRRGGGAAAYATQDRPDRHRPRPAVAGARTLVAEHCGRAGPAVRRTRFGAGRRAGRPRRSGPCCWVETSARACRRCGSAPWCSG